MLLEVVNLADVARGMGPQDPRSGKGEGSSLKVRQPAPQVEKTSGVAKTGRDSGNVRGEAVSDQRGSGAWLERRAELIKLAQPFLDRGVPVPQVHAALQQFVERKRWGYLSPETLEDIVESAIDALVEAEMEEDVAQRAGNLVPEADELQEVSLPAGLAFRVTAAGIEWEARSQGPTAACGRGASAKQERCVQLQEHADWLRQYLATGSSSAGDVFKSAAAAGLSVSQLKRAKQALGVRCYKEPVPKGRWIWDACGACGERVEGSELRVDLRQVEESEGIKEVEECSKFA